MSSANFKSSDEIMVLSVDSTGGVFTWGQCPSGIGGVAGVVHSPGH